MYLLFQAVPGMTHLAKKYMPYKCIDVLYIISFHVLLFAGHTDSGDSGFCSGIPVREIPWGTDQACAPQVPLVSWYSYVKWE